MARNGPYQIEVVNMINPAEPVVYHVNAVEGQNLYQAMCALRDKPGSDFTFEIREVVEHPGQHFIASINGVGENQARLFYWKIYEGGNQTPEGVDFRYPRKGEHYKFAYEHTPDRHANRPR